MTLHYTTFPVYPTLHHFHLPPSPVFLSNLVISPSHLDILLSPLS